MGNLQPILFVVAILVVFWLLLIRPQQKRRREQQQMQQALRPGSEVVTTAGMFARVVATEGDDAILLEVAPGVTCKYMRQAIMRVVPDPQAAAVTDAPAPTAGADASAADGQPEQPADEQTTQAPGEKDSRPDNTPGEHPDGSGGTEPPKARTAEERVDGPAGRPGAGKSNRRPAG